jgi:hypothetical protein
LYIAVQDELAGRLESLQIPSLEVVDHIVLGFEGVSDGAQNRKPFIVPDGLFKAQFLKVTEVSRISSRLLYLLTFRSKTRFYPM